MTSCPHCGKEINAGRLLAMKVKSYPRGQDWSRKALKARWDKYYLDHPEKKRKSV